MAYTFAEGTKFFLGTTFGTATPVTAISNSDPAKATAAAHTLVNGDEILLSSGWEDAGDTIWKATGVASGTFDVAGFDSSNTTFYPPGTGVGSVQKVAAWQEIGQILTVSSTGGDPRFVTISPLARRNDIQVPVGFNAQTITLSIGYDPTLPGYQALLKASRTLEKRGFKFVMSGGQTGYGYGYVAVSEMPAFNRDQPNTVQASIALLGKFVGYAS